MMRFGVRLAFLNGPPVTGATLSDNIYVEFGNQFFFSLAQLRHDDTTSFTCEKKNI